MKLVVVDSVVRQHHLQEFREDARSILKEQLAVRCRRSDHDITALFSLRTKVAIESVVDRVHGLRAATKNQNGWMRLCRIIAIGKHGLVVNGRAAHHLRPLEHFRTNGLAQECHQRGHGESLRAPLLHPESPPKLGGLYMRVTAALTEAVLPRAAD